MDVVFVKVKKILGSFIFLLSSVILFFFTLREYFTKFQNYPSIFFAIMICEFFLVLFLLMICEFFVALFLLC